MNQISMPESLENVIEPLRMRNTSTEVFIETLVLSGSELAKTNREKEFIIWLAQRDQNVVGRGTVGFDLDEMPWIEDDFPEMKRFVLSTIKGVINKVKWDVLNYEPNEEWIRDTFEHFARMIQLFEAEHINSQHYLEWISLDEDDDEPTVPQGYPKCKEHGVYLSCLGCVICNSIS
ncbi:hypothetical protein D3C78_975440 [compost metagenome]